MTLDPLILLALAGAGMLAGFVDAIAGGGGLIALPALLAAGVPPILALGTNKVQSAIGTGAAAITYWRKGFVSLPVLAVAIVCTWAASFLGAYVVKQIDTSLLSVAVPVMLIAIALYFLIAPKLSDDDRHARLQFSIFEVNPYTWQQADGRIVSFPFQPPEHVAQPLIQTVVDELNGEGRCPSTGETASLTNRVMDALYGNALGKRDA